MSKVKREALVSPIMCFLESLTGGSLKMELEVVGRITQSLKHELQSTRQGSLKPHRYHNSSSRSTDKTKYTASIP